MKKSYLLLATVALIAHGCTKDNDFVNTTSTLEVESPLAGTTEGGYVYANLALSQPLSKDLVLEGSFSVEGINAYINDDDYKKEFEYSVDGVKWEKEANPGQVRFKSLTTSLTVRIPTVDDNQVETIEEVNLNFKPVDAQDFTLTDKLKEIRIVVNDNDATTEIEEDDSVLMEVYFSEDYSSYTIAVRDHVLSLYQKRLIDGDYKKVVDPLVKALKLLDTPAKLSTFYILYTNGPSGGQTTIRDPNKNQFNIRIGFEYAYIDFDGTPISFDENGQIAYALIHELGHFFSLSWNDQIVLGNEFDNVKPCEGGTFRLVRGCTTKNSYLNTFYQEFYNNTTPTNGLNFVSDYAAQGIEEDFAESFIFYMAQDRVPVSTDASSRALKKINFIRNNDKLGKLRDDLRKLFPSLKLNPLTYKFPVYE